MKNKLFFALVPAFLLVGNISAQQETIDLWPAGKTPNATKVKTEDKIENQRQLVVGAPAMYAYFPSDDLANGMAVIICPGGGYAREAIYKEGHDIAKIFNTMGVAAFVLKYRLPQGANVAPEQSYKAPLQDAQRAVKIVRSRAGEWKINPDKIGIAGFSAGGHLAASAGTLFRNDWSNIGDAVDRSSCRPDFMVLFYPVISADQSIGSHRGSFNNLLGKNANDELLTLFSCEKQVTPETPPAIFILADDDKAVNSNNSIVLYQALKNNKVPAALHIFTKGGHGFGLPVKGEAVIWPQLVKDWLRETVGL